jgi:TonB-linked SusC/RagA family outer membrane protein
MSFLLSISFKSFSQQATPRTISGKITNSENQPLSGVAIMVKGGQEKTISNAEGVYRIVIKESGVILQFSSMGYELQEKTVGTGSVLDIVLSTAVKGLDDVVVVGYGTSRKRDLTGSTSSLNGKELKDLPVAGFDQAMTGKMAGIRVSNSNPAPGAGQSVIIRGIGSISASPAPLYIIDGMPLPESYNKNENPLNAINPIDIESIEVLKDASATAIYGARASNGVILITTKRGKSGKPVFAFSSNLGRQTYTNKIEMLDATEYKQYIADSRSQSYVLHDPFLWDDARRSFTWNTPDDQRIINLKANDKYNTGVNTDPRTHRWFVVNDAIKNSNTNTNWMDVITNPALIQNYQVSASAGTEKINYMVSANYLDQEGIVKNTGYTRYGARINLDIKASDKIKFGINLAPSREVFKQIGAQAEGSEGPNGFLSNALLAPPIYAPYDSIGNVSYLGNYSPSPYEFNIVEIVNPLNQLDIQNNTTVTRNIGSLFTEWKFLKNFNFRTEINTDIRNSRNEYFLPSTVPLSNARSQVNVGRMNEESRLYLNSQSYVTYNGKFKGHTFNAVAGYQAEKTTWNRSFIRKQNFIVDDIRTLNTGGTIQNPLTDATTNKGSSTIAGYFARFNYNYLNKYYFTGTLRRDGSSKFGEDNRWGNFPSFSAAWRLTEENFFPKSMKKVVTDWKIRAGWGIVGNSSIPDFLAYNRLNNVSYILGNSAVVGTADAGIAYTGLGWESTKDINIGTDIEFWNGRIGIVYDYYVRTTSDMLYNVSLSEVTGFSSQTRNVSSMENRGMEFTINSKNLIGAFKWNSSFNIYYNRNKVLDLGPQKNPIFGGPGGDNTVTVEGKPLSNFWGYQYLGPYRNWNDVKNSPIVGGNNPNANFRSIPGDAKFADINGDGIIDRNDFTIIGNPQPDFMWGLTNQFSYKNIDLSIQVNGVSGGDVSLRTFKREVFGGNGGRYNIPKFLFDNYWRPDRTDAKYETPTRRAYAKQFFNSSQNIEKGTFVNINNITLGYTLPTALLSKYKISSLRVYASVFNAFIFTKYNGWNPEANVGGNNPLQQGVDETSYPMARTVSFGINLNF